MKKNIAVLFTTVLFLVFSLVSLVNAQNRLIYYRNEPVFHAQVGGITIVDINWACNGAVFAIEPLSNFEVQIVNKENFIIEPIVQGLWVVSPPQEHGFILTLKISGDLNAPGSIFRLHTYGVFWGDKNGNLTFDTSVAQIEEYDPHFVSINYGNDTWELYARQLKAFGFGILYYVEDNPPVWDISTNEFQIIDISPSNPRSGEKIANANHLIGWTDGDSYTGPLVRYTKPEWPGYTLGTAYIEYDDFLSSFHEYLE
ncbi:MAG: hypothetical protein Q8Q23_05495 [bacterium]|nr:hypothetical protein [bacterium]